MTRAVDVAAASNVPASSNSSASKKPIDLPSLTMRPLAVSVGDTVVFGQYAGSNTIEVDGEELIIMGESEIYAVVE